MTTTELDLMQLASSGQKLARVDDVDYLSVHVVLSWPSGGAPTVYCAYGDWLTTPAARLAAKDQALAELQALNERQAAAVLELKRRASAAEARIKELEAQAKAADPGPCPDCGKHEWHSVKALQMHRQRAHQGMVARPRAPVQLAEDDQGWRCAEPHCTGAFTRDLHNPAYCTQHANIHMTTNGHEIAA